MASAVAAAAMVVQMVIVCCLGMFVVLTWTVPPPPTRSPLQASALLTRTDAAVSSLQAFLRFETVCDSTAPLSIAPASEATFSAARQHLQDTYAAFLDASDVTLSSVNHHSLLVEWRGAQPRLPGVLLYGHYDVVPVGAKTAASWSHEAFGGGVHDGFIWGRGAIDMKSAVIGILEALMHLHASGFRPARSVLLAIGHDEEVGGPFGATAIAAKLEQEGRRVAVVWDEGMVLLSDGVGNLVHTPVAMVGTAEKGRHAFQISVATAGGHASMPPVDGSHAGRVVGDILRGIDATQPPLALRPPVTHLFKAVAPHAPFLLRAPLFFCDSWPASWLLPRLFSRLGPANNALVRTTVVPTLSEMGVALNVVPMHASVTVDMRNLPGDEGPAPERFVRRMLQAAGHPAAGGEPPASVGGVIKATIASALRKVFATAKVGIEVTELPNAFRPAKVTASSGPWWDLIAQAIQTTLVPHDSAGQPMNSSAIVVPNLLSGRTDSAKFEHLSDHGIFRFTPISLNLTAGDPGLVHGIDERLHVNTFLAAIRCYIEGIRLLSSNMGA